MKLTAIPIDGYYILTDAKIGDYIDLKYTIGQSKEVHPGLPLFDAPSEWGEDVEKLAYDNYWDKTKRVFAENSRPDMVIGSVDGYKAAKEKYQFTREDMYRLVHKLKEYTRESQDILGHDERGAEEFVNIFIASLQKPKSYEITEYEFIDNKIKILKWKEM